MSQREKYLAIAVGGLLVAMLGFFAYSSWSKKITEAKTEQLNLETAIGDKEARVAAGLQAFQKLQEFRRRSLPADAEVARSQYKAWLLDLAEKQVKLDDPQVSSGSIGRKGDAYQRVTLGVSGEGTLEQLTDLLYRIYTTDFVHHVRSLDVQPIEDSRKLKIQLSLDALVVNGTEASDSLKPQPSALAEQKSLEYFLATILERNLFASANRPPEIVGGSTQRVTVGETMSVSLKAEDEDELDEVTFELGEGSAEGATVDSSGRVRFRTGEVGTYEIIVVASDDGVPSKSSRKTITVVVSERPKVVVTPDPPAPKPKPYFEDAEFAFVTAILEVNGQKQLWLNIRTSGETLKLGEGDEFEVKRLKGIVSRIGQKDIDVTAAGESRRFELGENLAHGEVLPAPADGDPSEPAGSE